MTADQTEEYFSRFTCKLHTLSVTFIALKNCNNWNDRCNPKISDLQSHTAALLQPFFRLDLELDLMHTYTMSILTHAEHCKYKCETHPTFQPLLVIGEVDSD